jgi:hypothetical protein
VSFDKVILTQLTSPKVPIILSPVIFNKCQLYNRQKVSRIYFGGREEKNGWVRDGV